MAALFAGINYETLKAWCRDDDDFSAQLNAMEAEGVFHHAGKLWEADEKSGPQVAASKFFLSTRKTDPWVTQQATEVKGNLTVADVARQAAAQDELKKAMEESE